MTAENGDVEELASMSCPGPIVSTLSCVGAAESWVHVCFKPKKLGTTPFFSCLCTNAFRSVSTYIKSASFALPLAYFY